MLPTDEAEAELLSLRRFKPDGSGGDSDRPAGRDETREAREEDASAGPGRDVPAGEPELGLVADEEGTKRVRLGVVGVAGRADRRSSIDISISDHQHEDAPNKTLD